MHGFTEAAETLGLRDRKRQETRGRLERAAVDIVLEEGLDHLTIDAISERADVSPRTFFNYFDSKEDAILGVRITDDTERIIARAAEEIHPESLLDGVLQLLLRLLDSSLHDKDLHKRRQQIMREHPELLYRRFSQMNRMLESMTAAVQTLWARLHSSSSPDDLSAGEAQVVLMMCGAAIRSATADVSCHHTAVPAKNFTTVIGRQAATLVREAINKLP
ncbi:MAG TPA: TetR/AcrR family transcriptional regulator [Microbacteriaceae bacterium]|nr:TetR/AcrR family transcriptional regulator [Microbacteriaceae bacterium]